MDPRGYELIRKWLETGDQEFSREITPPQVNNNGMYDPALCY